MYIQLLIILCCTYSIIYIVYNIKN